MFDRCASSRTILWQPKSVNVQKMVDKQVVTVVQNSGPLFQKSFQVPEERRNPVAEEKFRGENTWPARDIFTFVIRTGRRMRSPPSIETWSFSLFIRFNSFKVALKWPKWHTVQLDVHQTPIKSM